MWKCTVHDLAFSYALLRFNASTERRLAKVTEVVVTVVATSVAASFIPLMFMLWFYEVIKETQRIYHSNGQRIKTNSITPTSSLILCSCLSLGVETIIMCPTIEWKKKHTKIIWKANCIVLVDYKFKIQMYFLLPPKLMCQSLWLTTRCIFLITYSYTSFPFCLVSFKRVKEIQNISGEWWLHLF